VVVSAFKFGAEPADIDRYGINILDYSVIKTLQRGCDGSVSAKVSRGRGCCGGARRLVKVRGDDDTGVRGRIPPREFRAAVLRQMYQPESGTPTPARTPAICAARERQGSRHSNAGNLL
jgi:hypothetical protein